MFIGDSSMFRNPHVPTTLFSDHDLHAGVRVRVKVKVRVRVRTSHRKGAGTYM